MMQQYKEYPVLHTNCSVAPCMAREKNTVAVAEYNIWKISPAANVNMFKTIGTSKIILHVQLKVKCNQLNSLNV